MKLKFRPHHFLCTLAFEGKGYSDDFVANFWSISQRLKRPESDQESILVTRESDSICEPCPNRVGAGCESQKKIDSLDEAHAKVLGLKPGTELSWGEAKQRIREQMTLEAFHVACLPCSWKSMGVCEKALRKLKGLPLFLVFFLGTSAFAEPIRVPKAFTQALRKGEYSGLAKVAATHPLFDHAQALLARHELDQALQKISKKQQTEAVKLAQRSAERWGRIQVAVASSPWLKRMPDSLGQAELLMARVAALKKKKLEAKRFFEQAFDRMSLALVSWQDVDAYFGVCGEWEKRESADVCVLWAKKLLAVFPKAAPERKELESKWLPAIELIEKLPMVASGGRLHQTYKLTDADLEAWEAILPKIREGNLRWSCSLFEDFLEKYPRSHLRQKARYWWAQCLKGSGPDKKALSLLEQVVKESPLSFYGLLSARQLNQDPHNFLSTDAPPESPRSPNLHPSEWLILDRAEALLEAGLLELAALELREVRIREALDSDFLVYLAKLHQRAGGHLGAFTVVTELIQRGSKAAATRWASEIIFPVEQWARIESATSLRKIDPIWVLSLMKQESAFDDLALSSSGAVGLMQVMPATALDVDPAVFRFELSGHDRNVAIGTGYMAFLFKRFKGNLALATAAYNAGPQAVDRWLKEYGAGLGLIEFIESIPYRETRDYVGSIIRNYAWYSRKLKEQAIPATTPSAAPSGTPAAESAPKNELEYFWKPPTPQNGSA